MKKNLLFVFTMLCALSCFTGCSDDDKTKSPLIDETLSFDGDDLKLTYSGTDMPGKKVSFTTTDGKTATITLTGGSLDLTGIMSSLAAKASPTESLVPGVIPGQVSTVLSNVALTQVGETYTFSGTAEANGAQITYSGDVSKELMAMKLEVVMPTNNLIGTWNLAPLTPGSAGEANVSEPVHVIWTSDFVFNIDLFGMGMPMPFKPGDLLTLALNIPMSGDKTAQQLMGCLLKDVTFKNDGNIIAQYSSKNNIANPVWETSPANIAQYYVKDNVLYLVLNPNMILGAITKTATKVEIPLETIMAMVTQFLPMLSTGFPLSYTLEGNNLSVYLEPTFAKNLLTAASGLLGNEAFVAELIKELQGNAALAPYLPMVKGVLEQFPGVVKGTKDIQLGLNFVK